MDSALEDVAFLARSSNRVAVLDALVDGSRTRSEIHQVVDASRVTIGRTLAELEGRRWVESDGRRYRIAPTGVLIVREFRRVLDTLRGERSVRDVLQWFPLDEAGFDVAWLPALDVTVSREADPTLPIRRAKAWLESGDSVRAVTYQLACFEEMHGWTVEGDQRLAFVSTPATYDSLTADRKLSPLFDEMLRAETVSFYVFDGTVPIVLFLVDGEVGIGLTDGDGFPQAFLRSDADGVSRWATETYEAFLTDAERIDRVAYTP